MLRFRFNGGPLDGNDVSEISTGEEKELFISALNFTEGKVGHHFNRTPSADLQALLSSDDDIKEKMKALNDMKKHRYTSTKIEDEDGDDVVIMEYSMQ